MHLALGDENGGVGVSYEAFLNSKKKKWRDGGVVANASGYDLFPFQKAVVEWACKKGRAAIFAGTGLGKTRMQVTYADLMGGNALILCPVAVARQTIEEAASIGVEVVRDVKSRITITNYEQLHNVDWTPDVVILDESSILKSHDGKTRRFIQDRFAATPYKLCLTATPAPNDYMELGTTSEFLGVASRLEMLAEYFTHDGGDTSKWRLKGHAKKDFWQWVASWALAFTSPDDLGFDGSAYKLPPLEVHSHEVGDPDLIGGLFGGTIDVNATNVHKHNRDSMHERADLAVSLASGDKPCVIWCTGNDEQAYIAGRVDCVSVMGSDSPMSKEAKLDAFAKGAARVLVTKPSICGFGLNWQHCDRMVFASFDYSFEKTYQAIRRCYRFGQKNPVHVHLIHDAITASVLSSVTAKQMAFDSMHREMRKYTGDTLCLNS